ncbi:MAG TPA: MlaD family protein [Candidatus Acidoferrum sp.]|nr:MlaD family protein [Candidatus Acidoferrum sp.]
MANRKQLTWTELRVGIFVLVGLFVLGSGIFYVTAPGILGPKYGLKTFLPEVSGLSNGAPVRLDGVEIGNVDGIKIVPRTKEKAVDKNKNIEVDMRIDRNYRQYILTDSTASLVTEGLLGNRYVNVTRGVTGLPIADKGEIPGAEEKAMKEVVERSAEVLGNLSALSENIQELIQGVRAGKGSLGKLLTDEQAYYHLNNILAKGDTMITNVQAGQGTLGKLVASDEMYTKVDKGLDNVNVILADVRAGKGTIGKLMYDPTLYDQAKEAMTSGNVLLRDARAGKGTLGKLTTDETLYKNLRDASANVATAAAKLNDNTTTAGKLFSDPKLYDNLAGLTGDMRLLIGDFRQNPKKFLHIKVTIF